MTRNLPPHPLDDGLATGANPFVAVPVLLAALRRRWRVWTVGAVLGALAAVAVFVVFPPDHTATTTLGLGHVSGGDQARAMVTDARLLETRTVAQGAIDALGLHLRAQQLVDAYQPQILSDSLLKISATGPSDDEAVQRVEAVAASFLAFRSAELRRQVSLTLGSLEERRVQLNTELLAVNDKVNSMAKPQGEADVRALGELLVQRATLADQLTSVRQRIDASTFDTDSIIARSRVVDPPGVEAGSSLSLKSLLPNVVVGIVLGLLLTGGWVVVQEVTTDRLRRRGDVAVSLGAPVCAGTRPIRGPMWRHRHRFRRLLAAPDRHSVRVVEHLRGVLARSGEGRPVTLALVSIDTDREAALAVASLATDLIREGTRVLVLDLTSPTVLARLTTLNAVEAERLPLVGDISAPWMTFPPAHAGDPETLDRKHRYLELATQADVILALATIDLAEGADNLGEVARTAVAFVTAGRSSATALCSVSATIRSVGVDLDSAILVGADPRDESLGLPGPTSDDPLNLAVPQSVKL